MAILKALLRQLSRTNPQAQTVFALTDRSSIVGRDPKCEIVVDSSSFASVSRRHAEIRPLFKSFNGTSILSGWEICDLDSANGTYINKRRLLGCQVLQHGDRIRLTQDGPDYEVVFEREFEDAGLETVIAGDRSTLQPISQITNLTLSQLIPIFSNGADLLHKAYLVPGMVTVIFVVMMFASLGQPLYFNLTLSAYLSIAAYYFVYQLCGKSKPWWVLLAAMTVTVLILRSPILQLFIWVFRDLLPGKIPTGQVSFLGVLVAMFFGAGLMEELLKAIPIFMAWLVGSRLRSPWRSRVGVREPLDGILLGAASAVGFTLIETLELYVPSIVQSVSAQVGNSEIGELTGLQLLIPRVLGSVAGHIAYSGYFGYFIGLSMLKPSKRWQIIALGYLSAAFLHALWNAIALFNFWLLAIVGGLSYAFLAAAILKARTFKAIM
ncbi:PrsW family glutamic-type intramembrane protease [Tumidithrix elongata RA019]|uniref:PrsW family glutamic-type intramembrane protease n=1 Tax=Tumidithrix elongata BACA0141 TaxID=2716417 RepID=A0AAW9PSM6_9CYAN|nr:PrsW family glutamic-type intramembrane protease [Tumidithrix elongata RA019]